VVQVPFKLVSQGQFVVNTSTALVMFVVTVSVTWDPIQQFVLVEVLMRLMVPSVKLVELVDTHQVAVPRSTRPGAGQHPPMSLLVTTT
jgi:hypothetical protein